MESGGPNCGPLFQSASDSWEWPLSVFCSRLKSHFFLFVTHNLVSVPAKWHCHFGHVYRSYLLTYLLPGIILLYSAVKLELILQFTLLQFQQFMLILFCFQYFNEIQWALSRVYTPAMLHWNRHSVIIGKLRVNEMLAVCINWPSSHYRRRCALWPCSVWSRAVAVWQHLQPK